MQAPIEPRGLIGIGYEGQDLDEFIARLVGNGTRILADVRLNPISRKRGFSKRLLAAALADAGISYWHTPELGNPKWNRAGFGGSLVEVLAARERFAHMICGETAEMRLHEIADAVMEGVVAVMCFEADEQACHRYVVLNEVHRRLAMTSKGADGRRSSCLTCEPPATCLSPHRAPGPSSQQRVS